MWPAARRYRRNSVSVDGVELPLELGMQVLGRASRRERFVHLFGTNTDKRDVTVHRLEYDTELLPNVTHLDFIVAVQRVVCRSAR